MTSPSKLSLPSSTKPKQNINLQHLQQPQPQLQPHHPQWQFHLSTVVSPPSTSHAISDVLGSINFHPSHHLLATAGISRKIRIFNVPSLINNHNPTTRYLDHKSCCEFYICAPAKLSTVRFRAGLIGAGDYDGVVTEYDLEKRVAVFERDEHGGRRVWSVAYSSDHTPTLCASGSDDGTAHIWDVRARARAEIVRPGARGEAVCSVEFEPDGVGFGVGCADRSAYLYDARALGAGPVWVMRGHGRAVTYVKFVGEGRVVTSGADGSHRLWRRRDGEEGGKEERVYRGHENERSFVGMEVWRGGGLIGCGSESDEVYVYDLRWGEPVWVEKFGSEGFVSCVSWREGGDGEDGVFVAGGSDGTFKVFLVRRNTD
ncbi:E3 ubiquitin-protein ligase RFWD2 protein [Dioscorea alata]|uniref:E3 ubiquitin-protein ligase RFWD2 protein n=1 Tax=Dioscorea alata TaxID=55571 RepID=A0ACB7V7W7_DIOAL|nr:E3 ubiquitin-protein ligase RFWD2 protein [Dioscorea alata]